MWSALVRPSTRWNSECISLNKLLTSSVGSSDAKYIWIKSLSFSYHPVLKYASLFTSRGNYHFDNLCKIIASFFRETFRWAINFRIGLLFQCFNIGLWIWKLLFPSVHIVHIWSWQGKSPFRHPVSPQHIFIDEIRGWLSFLGFDKGCHSAALRRWNLYDRYDFCFSPIRGRIFVRESSLLIRFVALTECSRQRWSHCLFRFNIRLRGEDNETSFSNVYKNTVHRW